MSKEELQEKYLELTQISRQMKQMQNQIGELEGQAVEIQEVIDGLGELAGAKLGVDMLVPVSPGIFMSAALKSNSSLIVNVGSNVAVEKDFEATRELLKERISEVQSAKLEMYNALKEISGYAERLEEEVQNLLKEE